MEGQSKEPEVGVYMYNGEEASAGEKVDTCDEELDIEDDDEDVGETMRMMRSLCALSRTAWPAQWSHLQRGRRSSQL